MKLSKKKGLIGKIFAVIGILLLIIIITIGVTAYQVYGLVKDLQEKTPIIQTNVQDLMRGKCDKLESVKSDLTEIKIRATNACRNPIINIAVQKLDQIPIKCNQLSTLDEQITNNLNPINEYCTNSSLKS
jgi:hypothetical protein